MRCGPVHVVGWSTGSLAPVGAGVGGSVVAAHKCSWRGAASGLVVCQSQGQTHWPPGWAGCREVRQSQESIGAGLIGGRNRKPDWHQSI